MQDNNKPSAYGTDPVEYMEKAKLDTYDHMAPVRHLVKVVIHKGKPLEELVTKQRYRRKRSAPQAVPSPVGPVENLDERIASDAQEWATNPMQEVVP